MEVNNLFGSYKNLKNGHIYSVIGIFTHSETNEKLVAYHDSDNNKWVRPLDSFLKNLRNGKVNNMRKFDETIFFGCEDCLEKCYILHRRLEEAFDILGGLQQPNHSDSEETEKEVDFFASNLEEDLADIGMDIIIALGLSEILSKKKLSKAEINLFDAAKQYAITVNDRITCESDRDSFIERKYEDALENLGGASLDYATSVKSPPYDK